MKQAKTTKQPLEDKKLKVTVARNDYWYNVKTDTLFYDEEMTSQTPVAIFNNTEYESFLKQVHDLRFRQPDSKEGLHTQGEWVLNWQRDGYTITAEFPEGWKRIALLTPDNGYTTKEDCKLNGMQIVKAVNERKALLDSHGELKDALEAMIQLSGKYLKNTHALADAKTAINNAKNI